MKITRVARVMNLGVEPWISVLATRGALAESAEQPTAISGNANFCVLKYF